MKRFLFTGINLIFLYSLFLVKASNIRGLNSSEEPQYGLEDDVTERPIKDWLIEKDGTVRIIAKYADPQGRRAVIRAAVNVTKDLPKYSIIAFTLPNAEAANSLWQNRGLISMDNDHIMQALEAFDDGGKSSLSEIIPASATYLNEEVKPYGIISVQSHFLPQRREEDNVTIKVCVVDTGISLGHPDLPDLDSGYIEGIETDVGFWGTDALGHGSHVAGTIAGLGNEFGVEGVNPTGSSFGLIVAKGLSDTGQGSASKILESVSKCVDMGARVINLSLGCNARFSFSPCGSATEEGFYNDLFNSGILVVAAAGNSGNNKFGFPASYPSVMSVSSVDMSNAVPEFSQFNEQVEISAPGVDILSTSTYISVRVVGNDEFYAAEKMLYSPVSTVTAFAVDCGLGYSCQANDKICIIERGEITFVEKVFNCEKGGGVGAIIYNNVAGTILGTLAGATPTIPVVGVSNIAGMGILNNIGQSKIELTTDRRNNPSYGYLNLSGTSMSSPHVAGVAAKVWAYFPECSNLQIRNALLKSAKIVNESGHRCDNLTGFGLIQAKAAYDLLLEGGCDAGGTSKDGALAIGGCSQLNEGEVKSCGQSFNSCADDRDCCSGRCIRGLFRSYCKRG